MNGDENIQAPNFELVIKQLRPSFIYRLTDNPTMCHRFTIQGYGKSHLNLVCNACHQTSDLKRKKKMDWPKPRSRKAKGNAMENDPQLDHIYGCEPVLYLKTMQQFEAVHEKQKAAKSPYDFPLVKVVKVNSYMIIHRWIDDRTKCYQFRYVHSAPSHISAHCVKCSWLCVLQKVICPLYHEGFLDNPRLRHLPGCEPLIYEEVMVTHSQVDMMSARKQIRAWCSKKDVNLLDNNTIDNESTYTEATTQDNHCLASGVEVIESRMPLTYLYRIPESSQCFRFTIQSFSMSNTGLQCAGCLKVVKKAVKGEKSENVKKSRASDGFSMRDDPTLNHLKGCFPEEYADTVKQFRMVPVKTGSQGCYEFPLMAMQSQVLCQCCTDYKMIRPCVTVLPSSKTKTSCVNMRCSSCNSLSKKKMNISFSPSAYTANATGFLVNPLHGHIPGCKPSCYKEVMRKNDHVELSRARNIVNGLTEEDNCEDTDENTPTDFPVLVIQKRNTITFIYRNPSNRSQAFQFNQLRHKDSSNLVCSTCSTINNKKLSSTVVIRKSDGLSMENDPAKNHLTGCRPPSYSRVAEMIKPQDNESLAAPAYGFRLETRALQEKFSAVYRLNEDPTRCYIFNSLSYILKFGQLVVNCGECQLISSTKWRTPKDRNLWRRSKPKYRCTAAGFIDDPSLNHVAGCKPLRFDAVMKKNIEAEKEDCIDFLKYKFAGADKDRMNTTRLIDVPRKRVKVADDEDIDEHSERSEGIRAEVDDVGNTDNMATFHTKSETLSMMFSKVFEVPFFTEDEVEISVKDRTFVLQFKREVSATGMEGCFLCYSINLPPSVDVKFKTIWNNGVITLSANRIQD